MKKLLPFEAAQRYGANKETLKTVTSDVIPGAGTILSPIVSEVILKQHLIFIMILETEWLIGCGKMVILNQNQDGQKTGLKMARVALKRCLIQMHPPLFPQRPCQLQNQEKLPHLQRW